MRGLGWTAIVVIGCGGGGGDPGDPDAAQVEDARSMVDGEGPLFCGGPLDETSTGVRPGAALTVVDGDVTVTTAGTLIDRQDIHGFLRISASNVIVRDSIIRGRGTTATTAIVRIDDDLTNVVIEHSEIAAAEPSVDVDGLWASNARVYRVHVRGGVDGMKIGSNTEVLCSYVHELVSFASDPNQGGGPTHNDAIQILAGTNIMLVGNTLVAATDQNAAIQITQDFGAVDSVFIQDNWADGGGCTFNFSHNGGSALAVTTRDNRFGRGSFFDCPILKSTQTTLTSEGDVWDDDGTPVPVQTHD